MSNNPEQLNNQENTIETQHSAAEQLEKLRNNPESSIELSPRDLEAKAEQLRIEALKNAISVESGGKEINKQKPQSEPSGHISLGKKQLEKSFKQTMKHVQDELPTSSSQTFSKIIHNKTIEKTSDIVGNTIARPNAMLAGAISAFILTLIVYTIAKTLGYKLSGFETIASFIIGWIIGILYDYLRILITGKKN